MSQPEVTPELATKYGLSKAEFSTISTALGRIPTFSEMRVLAFYWSEPYSWKSATAVLNSLPEIQRSHELVQGSAGPGPLDMGNNRALVVKISSCGLQKGEDAEQAVAGCIRRASGEIMALGARPMSLYYSRFVGIISQRGTKKMVRLVSKGAKSSASRLHIPVALSQEIFDEGYSTQLLFHAVVLGWINEDTVISPEALGEGSALFLLRRKSRETVDSTPHHTWEDAMVQVCEELAARPYLIAMQPASLGGVALACVELALRGGSGISLNLNKIATGGDVLKLSERALSQETGRFIAVINRGFEQELKTICRERGVDCVPMGKVNGRGTFDIRHGRKKYCSIPLAVFRERPETPWHELARKGAGNPAETQEVKSVTTKKNKSWNLPLLELLAVANVLADEKSRICLNSFDVKNPPSDQTNSRDSVVFRSWGSGRIASLDPRTGGKRAIMSGARKVVCRGANPKGAVVSFGVGDLQDPEEFHSFSEMVAGVREACRVLRIPVVNKSVHFWAAKSIPTPLAGVVGLMEDENRFMSPSFRDPEDFVLMLGSHRGELGGSEYSRMVGNRMDAPPPTQDAGMEQRIHEIILVMNKVGLIRSARDVSTGGLAVALAHSLVVSPEGVGARIHMSSKISDEELLFGETQGLFILTIHEDSLIEIERLCMRIGVSCTTIGRVTGDGIFSFNDWIRLEVDKLRKHISLNAKKIP
ncbi:MAG: AIR synthase-related protein [Candidatus Neomarinimicrobiota bacterium]